MSEQECKHGLVSSTCSLCLHPNQPRPMPGATFDARFEGKCSNCGEDIEIGESITRMDPSGLYVHTGDCADEFAANPPMAWGR